MNGISHVPPGFRFHPTDEELVDYYLRRKINSRRIDFDVIKDVDLYRIEPWDLQEVCGFGREEQNEWFFFSHKDKKYPTGTRTNRATAAGFWKATGRDKAIYSKHDLIGMRKTLVFYKGRAPNGIRSDWIMHEYRLQTDPNATSQEEGWVVCRVSKKRIAATQRLSEHDSPVWYEDHVPFMPDIEYPKKNNSYTNSLNYYPYDHNKNHNTTSMITSFPQPDHHFLPLLESPTMLHPPQSSSFGNQTLDQNFETNVMRSNDEISGDEVTDWRVLDKFVASQLLPASESSNLIVSKQDSMVQDNASISSSICQIDLWK